MDWNSLVGSTSVVGSIARWLNNSTITAGAGGDADSILQEVINWASGSLKHWRMMPAPLTGNFIVGHDYVPLPTDMLEPDSLYITGINYQKLSQKTIQEVLANWSYDGNGDRIKQQPMIWYFDQDNFRFDSPADQTYPYAAVYYQNIPTLSDANPTNFLTQYYPRLVRCGVMAYASEWAKDSGTGAYDRTYWVELAEKEMYDAQVESDRARRGTEFSAVLVGGGAAGFPAYGGW